MGQRIAYYRTNNNKTFPEILVAHFTDFREWLLAIDKLSREEFDEPFGSEPLKAFLEDHTTLDTDLTILDNRSLGDLTIEFVGSYCGLPGRGDDIMELCGPLMSTWRYEASTRLVTETNDAELIKLWNYVVKGRSVKGELLFESFDAECSIGFLNENELEQLRSKISFHFGDQKAIKNKYRTITEKAKHKWAKLNSKNETFGISNHNPISSGLEYVCDVLEEIKGSNVSLITFIEL